MLQRPVVICGDSTLTAFQLEGAERSLAAPQLLRDALAARSQKLISLAKPGYMVGDSLAKSAIIASLDPSVVFVGHGGREATLLLTRRLRFIRCYQDGVIPGTVLTKPLFAVRRLGYGLFLRLLSSRAESLAVRLVGSRPNLSPEAFRDQLRELLDSLLAATSAQIIIVNTGPAFQSIWPFVPSVLAHNYPDARAAAAERPGIRVLELGRELVGDPANYQRDGVHFSLLGHERAAAAMLAVIDECATARMP